MKAPRIALMQNENNCLSLSLALDDPSDAIVKVCAALGRMVVVAFVNEKHSLIKIVTGTGTPLDIQLARPELGILGEGDVLVTARLSDALGRTGSVSQDLVLSLSAV